MIKNISRLFVAAMGSLLLFSCSGEEGAVLEEKESTVSVMGYKDEQGNLQWVRTDNAEQIEIKVKLCRIGIG